MIRVVQFDVYAADRNQTIAFWNTVSDVFMSFDGEQSWESWRDLKRDADKEFLERVKSMLPLWFFSDDVDDYDVTKYNALVAKLREDENAPDTGPYDQTMACGNANDIYYDGSVEGRRELARESLAILGESTDA